MRTPTRQTIRRAFTLIELLVTILVVAVLIGILIVAVSGALRVARGSGEAQTVSGLKTGLELFSNTFGDRLPPLVDDGEPLRNTANTPVDRTDPQNPLIRTIDETQASDGGELAYITGRTFSAGAVQQAANTGVVDFSGSRAIDKRYSKLSLTYFLTGALGRDVDGVDGPGLRLEYTNRGGWRFGRGTTYSAFYEPRSESDLVRSYASALEYSEHGRNLDTASNAERQSEDRVVLVNRDGVAFRYYRWEPTDQFREDDTINHLNVPRILLDPAQWSEEDLVATEDDIRVRGSRYAIVGPGPNGLFGTEDPDDIRRVLGLPSTTSDEVARRRAWEDNIVELGR